MNQARYIGKMAAEASQESPAKRSVLAGLFGIPMLAAAGTQVPAALYAKGLNLKSINWANPQTRAANAALKKVMGARVLPRHIADTIPHLANIKARKQPAVLAANILKGRPWYHLFGPKGMNPEILAHEYGHATGGKLRAGLMRARPVSMIGSGISSALVPFMKDEDSAFKAALLGSAFHAPVLGEEALASWKGMRGLQKLKASPRHAGVLSKVKPWKAFKGTPTYLAAAAVPMAVYGLSKLFGRYKKPGGEGGK